MQAAVAGPTGRGKHGRLAFEAEYAAVYVWTPDHDTGVVHQKAGTEIICTVDDDVVGTDELARVVGAKRLVMGLDLDVRIDVVQAMHGRFELRPAHIFGAVEDLPLKIRDVDPIEIDKTDRADAGCRQI